MIEQLMIEIASHAIITPDTVPGGPTYISISMDHLRFILQKFMPDEDNYEHIINVRQYATEVADEWLKKLEEQLGFNELYEKIVFSVDPPKEHYELKEKWSLEYWSMVDTVEEDVLIHEKDIKL